MDEAAKLAPFPFVGDADPVPASLLCLIPSKANTLLCSTKSVAKSLPSSIAKNLLRA